MIYLCRNSHKHKTQDGAEYCGWCKNIERKSMKTDVVLKLRPEGVYPNGTINWTKKGWINIYYEHERQHNSHNIFCPPKDALLIARRINEFLK